MATEKQEIMARQEKVKDNILAFVQTAEADGKLQFPKNYSAINALNSAWLYLKELVDKDNKPALEVCSPASVAQSLMKMLTNGLSVIKDQCYFIPYGGKLQCDISYHGKELMAKRAGGVLKVSASAIYQTDEFEFEVDSETGIKKIIKHKMTLESIGDGTKIKGAYAVVDYVDGRKEVTIMTNAQILNAWNQRKGNGLTPAHTKFTDEMACKTVRNRALKHAASTSDDAHLFEDMDENDSKETVPVKSKVVAEPLDFDEHEEVATTIEAPKENPIEQLKGSKQAEPVQAGQLFDQASKAPANGQKTESAPF